MICFQGGPTPSRQKGRVDCTVGVKGDIKGSMGACGESQGSRENSRGTFRGPWGVKGDVREMPRGQRGVRGFRKDQGGSVGDPTG